MVRGVNDPRIRNVGDRKGCSVWFESCCWEGRCAILGSARACQCHVTGPHLDSPWQSCYDIEPFLRLETWLLGAVVLIFPRI